MERVNTRFVIAIGVICSFILISTSILGFSKNYVLEANETEVTTNTLTEEEISQIVNGPKYADAPLIEEAEIEKVTDVFDGTIVEDEVIDSPTIGE